MSWNHSWSNLLKEVLTTKIIDSGRKLKADLKDKDAVYWKSARMIKSGSKDCEGTIGIQTHINMMNLFLNLSLRSMFMNL